METDKIYDEESLTKHRAERIKQEIDFEHKPGRLAHERKEDGYDVYAYVLELIRKRHPMASHMLHRRMARSILRVALELAIAEDCDDVSVNK